MLSQDCLYTLVERSLEGDKARIIGSIVNFLFGPDDPQKVIEQMASPQTRIVSLTITEGGYYIDQSTGELDKKNPTFNMISLIRMNPAVRLDISWKLLIGGVPAGFRRSR